MTLRLILRILLILKFLPITVPTLLLAIPPLLAVLALTSSMANVASPDNSYMKGEVISERKPTGPVMSTDICLVQFTLTCPGISLFTTNARQAMTMITAAPEIFNVQGLRKGTWWIRLVRLQVKVLFEHKLARTLTSATLTRTAERNWLGLPVSPKVAPVDPPLCPVLSLR